MLRKQVVDLKFDQGVNSKEDEKVLPPLSLVLAHNARRNKASKLEKRYGSVKLGDMVIGETTVLENASALATHYAELLQFNKQSLFAYSKSADRWANKGSAISAKCTIEDICKNNYEQTQVDQAIAQNIALLAWEDSRGGIRLSVYDTQSNTRLVDDYEAHATATRPRCIAFRDTLFLFYISGTNLIGRIINPLNPMSLGAEVTISSNVNSTNVHYDAEAQATFIAVAYNVQGSTQIRLHTLSDALAIQATQNIGENAHSCLTIFQGPMTKLFVAWHNTSSNKVRAAIFNPNLTASVAAFDVDATAGTVNRVTGYSLPDDSGVQLYYEYSAGATYNRFIRHATISNAGSVSGAAVFMRSVGIASKAFAYSPDTTDRGFLAVVHESTLQSTFFVVRNDGLVVAKLQQGKSGGILSRSLPSGISQVSSGIFYFAVLTKSPIISESRTDVLSFKGVSLAALDFTNLRNFNTVTLGGNTHIVGGVLNMYDGQSIVEHGFHLYPENIGLAESTGGSLTTTGIYAYRVCYEWTDSAGNLHRSAPSPAAQITLTGSNNRVTLTIPTLRITGKQSSRTNVNIVVYRTEDGGTTYRRASSATSLLYNDTTADTVSFVDDLSDVNLLAREPIYTTGNVLENIAPPSASLISRFGQRIALAGTEDDTIYISKERRQGFPVEFSDFLTVVTDIGDQTTAIAEMDDKLIIFKQASIYQVYGIGPDATGQNGEFSTPEMIADDIGCIDSNSVVLMPQGLMFKSAKGIWLLDRQLSFVYIGAAVERYNDLTVTAAVVVGDESEVRFTTLEGPTLVFNYVFQQWFTRTNGAANDATVWNSTFVHILNRENSQPSLVVKEQQNTFLDVDKSYSLQIETGWISFAALQQMQRVWRMILLGEYISEHTLRVRLAYNFSPIWVEEHTWKPHEALAVSAYGDDSPFGTLATFGGDDITYQPRMHLSRQKCQSVKVLIEDIPTGGSKESYSLTGVSFEVGVKKGAWKQKEAATI